MLRNSAPFVDAGMAGDIAAQRSSKDNNSAQLQRSHGYQHNGTPRVIICVGGHDGGCVYACLTSALLQYKDIVDTNTPWQGVSWETEVLQLQPITLSAGIRHTRSRL